MNIVEPTPEDAKEWAEWVAGLPTHVRAVAERFFPWKLYRMRSTGHRVTVHCFDEGLDDRVTLRVDVTAMFNVVLMERRVFGVSPDDLEERDLPLPDEPTGNADVGVARMREAIALNDPSFRARRQKNIDEMANAILASGTIAMEPANLPETRWGRTGTGPRWAIKIGDAVIAYTDDECWGRDQLDAEWGPTIVKALLLRAGLHVEFTAGEKSNLERGAFGVCPDNWGTSAEPIYGVNDGDADGVAECPSEAYAELIRLAIETAVDATLPDA